MIGALSADRTVAKPVAVALGCVCLAICGLAGMSGVAAGAITHNYLFQFSEVPAGPGVALPGPVTEVNSMTVDSGHLWVAEKVTVEGESTGNSRVDEFDATTGAFVAQPLHGNPKPLYPGGVALGHAGGETQLYTAEYIFGGAGPAIGVYTESGTKKATWTGAEIPAGPETPGGAFAGEINNVAVDQSTSLSDWAAGDVYVPDPSGKAVDVFHPEAGDQEKYVTQLTGIEPGVPFGEPRAVAVDPLSGDVLVADGGNEAVDVFEPTLLGQYAFVRQLTASPRGTFERLSGVAVDATNGDIYVIEGERGRILQFSREGVYLDRRGLQCLD